MQYRVCTSCGQVNLPGARLCIKCGSPLEMSKMSSENTVGVDGIPQPLPPPPSGGLVDSVKEAFVTLVKPTPPVVSPSGVVYNKMAPFTSVTKYLVIGMILFLIGMIFSTTGLFLTTSIWILISISFAPLLYVFWMYKQDRFEREPTELIVLSFGWGSFSVFLILMMWGFIFPDIDLPAWIAGPLPEEPLKILGVYLLATNKKLGREFNDHLDGMVYGAAAGGGFAIIENFLYVYSMMIEGVPLLLAVAIRSTIGHVFYSALVGRWLGLSKARKGFVQITDLIPGLLVAMVFHGFWNSDIMGLILEGFNVLGGDLGMLIGLFAVAGVFYLILYKYTKEAVRDEKLWGYNAGYAPK